MKCFINFSFSVVMVIYDDDDDGPNSTHLHINKHTHTNFPSNLWPSRHRNQPVLKNMGEKRTYY